MTASIEKATFGKKLEIEVKESNFNEAERLELDSRLAYDYLSWSNILSPEDAVTQTANWYSKFFKGSSARELMISELSSFKDLN